MTPERGFAIRESIALMARVGRCWSPSIAPDGEQLAFVSDLTGAPQVWRMPTGGGFPAAVTAFEEQVSRVIWSPDGAWLAVEAAPGGGMNSQIYIVQPGGGGRRRLTAGGLSNNWLGGWTKDGRGVLYSSNRDLADSMDCFRTAIDTGATEKLTSAGGTAVVEDISADGSRLLIKRVAYRGDSNVVLLETNSGVEQLLTAHDPPASFENARFSQDERAVFAVSNRDSDMACFCRLDLESGASWEILRARHHAELAEFALSKDGELAALIWNIAGRHELELWHLADNKSGPVVELPGEIIESPRFSPDGSSLVLCLTGARSPQDIWFLNVADGSSRQLTRSPHVGVNLERLVGAGLLEYQGHDGLPLSGWHYAPARGDAPHPTVLSFHGGPEGQEQPRFRYDYQALLAQGIAVFAPNVRGSSGFGKRFVNLDNGALRFDAIQDIATSARFLVDSGIAAAGGLGIMGGSYGGYMTMAGLAEFPELFAAGANLYGLVNFKTFFERTEPWMASISKVEYGDPETDGDLLDALSPIHKLDRVTAPTLVLHGANDTNVPVHEAEQVVAALRERDVPVDYILFPDEGHGFRNEHNRVAAAGAIVNWFVKYL